MIIDFHTHIFPDKVAASAIPALEQEGDCQACLDGTKADLLSSMDRHGISTSVIAMIATNPSQFDAILGFAKEIRSERLIPFPSFHPDDPEAIDKINRIHQAGFKGIKLHPYYQDFFLDQDSLQPLLAEISRLGLLLLMHTGFDIAFPPIRRADPAKIATTIERFPDLKFIASHFGAWQQWCEVREILLGRPIFMDISFALQYLEPEQAKAMAEQHPKEYLLFASDSPWADQGECLELLRKLGLKPDLEERILGQNGHALLGHTE